MCLTVMPSGLGILRHAATCVPDRLVGTGQVPDEVLVRGIVEEQVVMDELLAQDELKRWMSCLASSGLSKMERLTQELE